MVPTPGVLSVNDLQILPNGDAVLTSVDPETWEITEETIEGFMDRDESMPEPEEKSEPCDQCGRPHWFCRCDPPW
jgi:hypothetical protein